MNKNMLKPNKLRRYRMVKERKHQCSKDEFTMLRKLYQHYGHDYESITEQMNKFYPNSAKQTSQWKHILLRRGLTDITTNYLTPKEFLLAYRVLYDLIGDKKKHLWKCLQPYFPKHEITVFQISFKNAMVQCARNLICIYGVWPEKMLYYDRVRNYSQLTWFTILHLAGKYPSVLEQDAPWMVELFAACRKFEGWLRLLFDKGLAQLIDYSDLVNFHTAQLLPTIQPGDFTQVMEIILSLDTMIRVCNSLSPYESLEYAGCSTKRFKKAEKLKQKMMLEQILENEFTPEIPERQIFVAHDIQRLAFKRSSNPDLFTNVLPQQKNFLALSKEQQKIILNSPEATLLIPYITALDQSHSQSPAL